MTSKRLKTFIFLLFLFLPAIAYSNAYRTSPVVGKFTSKDNRIIRASVFQLDIDNDRVRFKIEKLNGNLTGGTLELREGSINGILRLSRVYGGGRSALTPWYQLRHTSGYRDFYIKIKNHNIYSGRIRIYANPFYSLSLNRPVRFSDLDALNYRFYSFNRNLGEHYQINLSPVDRNTNLYGSTSRNVSNSRHSSSSRNGGENDDAIVLTSGHSGMYYLAVYSFVNDAQYRITAHTLPKLRLPRNNASQSLSDINFRWYKAPGKSNEEHFLKIRDLNTNRVVYERSVGTSTSKSSSGINLQGGHRYRWVVYYRAPSCYQGECSSKSYEFSVSNSPPRLSNTSINYNQGAQYGTTFRWRVRYTDSDGDQPITRKLKIRNPVSGIWYSFNMIAEEANDVRGGRYYYYEKKLDSPGAYQYRFQFNDGQNVVESHNINGPQVIEPLAALRLERGVWINDGPIVANTAQNFDGQFRIQNLSGAPVSINSIVLAVHHNERNNSSHVMDLRHDRRVLLYNSKIWNYDFASGTIRETGFYKAVAKIHLIDSDGQGHWMDLKSNGINRNPRYFEVINDIKSPLVEVIRPSRGDNLSWNNRFTIQWRAEDELSDVNISRLSLYRGNEFIYRLTDTFLNGERSYGWRPPHDLETANNYRIKVEVWDESDNRATDYSDFFTIGDFTPPSLRFVTNFNGALWNSGDNALITWQSGDISGIAHTTLSLYRGNQFVASSGDLENSQFYNFPLPEDIGGDNFKFRLRAWDSYDNENSIDSPFFRIRTNDEIPPSIQVLSPSEGGEILQANHISDENSFRIEWNASDFNADNQPAALSEILIELEKNGEEVGEIARIPDPENNFYDWVVPDTLRGHILSGLDYQIKITATDLGGNQNSDRSNFNFTIARLEILEPEENNFWFLGVPKVISWNSEHIPNNVTVRISLTNDEGETFRITDNTENDGSFDWIVGDIIDNQQCINCRLNIATNDLRSGPNNRAYEVWNSSEAFVIFPPAPPEYIPPDIFNPNSNYYLGDDVLAEMSDEPVNLATGNYYYKTVDLEIPGNGLQFHFERSYNSKQTGIETSPIGNKWTHSYNIYLENPGEEVIHLYVEDGRQESYHFNENGVYEAQQGIYRFFERQDDGGYLVETKVGVQYRFDENGKLTAIADRNNNRLQFFYENNNLNLIQDTVGREIRLSYNDNNQIIELRDPLNRVYRYDYDEVGNLIRFTNAEGHSQSYTYDNASQLLTLSDYENHIITTNIYNDEGRVIQQTDASGEIYLFNYDTENNITRLTNPLGDITIYHFDELFRSTRVEDALGFVEEFTYDEFSNRTSVTDKNGNLTRFAYDHRGNLISKIDALGNETIYTYDHYNNIIRSEAPNETIRQMEYDERGNLIQTIDSENNAQNYEFNEQGLIILKRNARGFETLYDYDDEGNLIELIDSENQRQEFTHDAVGRLINQRDARGNETLFTYNNNNQITLIEDALGQTIQRVYDGNQKLISETDKRGAVMTFAYNEKSLLISSRDAYDQETRYRHDPINRKILETRPDGHQLLFAYDAVGNLISETDARNHTNEFGYDGVKNKVLLREAPNRETRYIYDGLQRLIETQDTYDRRKRRAYDENGHLISETDKRANRTNYSYNKEGWLIEKTDPEGHSVEYAYDPNGNQISMTDELGEITLYDYDSLDRLILKTDALGQIERWTYDENGNKTSYTNKAGNTWNYIYDELNRLVEEINPLGHSTLKTYDQNNNVISTTDEDGNQTRFEYDLKNRLIRKIDALGNETSYNYDNLDRLISQTDELGHQTDYAYDANGNLVLHSDAEGHINFYSYDEFNNLTRIVRPNGETHLMSYDRLDRKVAMMDPLGNQWTYEYDSNGKIFAITDPLQQRKMYSYNRKNQLTRIRYPDLEDTRFVYDARGNRVSLIDHTGQVNYFYDELGRLSALTNVWGENIFYDYSPLSQVSELIYPDEERVFYNYDALGRVSSFINRSGEESTITYNNRSLIESITYPHQGQTNYNYDELSRVSSITYNHQAQQENISLTYRYNERGDLVFETMDGIDLPMTDMNFGREDYRYDRGGRLISLGNKRYSYNDNGERISEEENGELRSYNYDSRGLLVRTQTDEDDLRYTYNGDSHLIQKESLAGRERYSIDPNQRLQQILSISDDQGNYREHYEFVAGLFSKQVADQRNYFQYDSQGNAVSIKNQNGLNQRAQFYSPFASIIFGNSTPNPEAFSAQWGIRQETADLYFMRDRFYDRSSRSFLSRDPVMGDPKNPRRYNPYSYVMNQPKRYIDPTGRIPEEVREILIKFGCYFTDSSNIKTFRCSKNEKVDLNHPPFNGNRLYASYTFPISDSDFTNYIIDPRYDPLESKLNFIGTEALKHNKDYSERTVNTFTNGPYFPEGERTPEGEAIIYLFDKASYVPNLPIYFTGVAYDIFADVRDSTYYNANPEKLPRDHLENKALDYLTEFAIGKGISFMKLF